MFCFCVGGKDKKETRGVPPFPSLRKQIEINKLTVTTEPAGFAQLNIGKFNQKFSYLSVLLLLLEVICVEYCSWVYRMAMNGGSNDNKLKM